MTRSEEKPVRRVKQVLYLDADQIKWLWAEHARTDAPISAIIRRAIDAYRDGRGVQETPLPPRT